MNQEIKYHYLGGEPYLEIPDIMPDILEYFWSKVEKTDTCWNWIGTKKSNNYGQFWLNNKPYRVHRIVYELYKGKIPNGLILDHLCRNRRCCNPEHLEPVTNQENVVRGLAGKTVNRYNPHKDKTHCSNGHPYSGENLLFNKNKRVCRTCKKDYQIKWRQKKNESK